MSSIEKAAIFYYIALAVPSVLSPIIDKAAAKRHKRRIPERTLLLLGALGGALPMLITMKWIRHKTLHKKFMLGLPVFILLHLVFVVFVFFFVP